MPTEKRPLSNSPCRHGSVRVQISAGLGNQLFQLAAGLALADRLGYRLILDRAWYAIQNYRPKRSFLLDRFCIRGELGSIEPLARCFSIERSFVHILAAQLTRNRPRTTRFVEHLLRIKIIQETNPHRVDNRLYSKTTNGNIMLCGYWQTADHFQAVRDTLQNLEPAFETSSGFLNWLRRISSCDSVFVHVRRGDFSKWPGSMMTPDFYRVAAGSIRSAGIHSPKWFIFSEDREWCRNNLHFLKDAEFVTFDSQHREIEEMFLMKACKGGIIANSSFSWWGAALGDKPSRPIVASRFRHGQSKGDVQKERLLSNCITVDEF